MSRGIDSSLFTIPAGETLEHTVVCDFVRCYSSSDSFLLGTNGDSLIPFDRNAERRAEGVEPYKKFRIKNPTANPLTVLMIWGFGEYRNDNITIADNVRIVNPMGQELAVIDDDAHTKLDAILAMMVNDSDKRKSLTPMTGSLTTVSNTSTSVVAGANGAIVRFGNARANLKVGGCIAYIQIRGIRVAEARGHLDSSIGGLDVNFAAVRDLYVAAGDTIFLLSNDVAAEAQVLVEQL